VVAEAVDEHEARFRGGWVFWLLVSSACVEDGERRNKRTPNLRLKLLVEGGNSSTDRPRFAIQLRAVGERVLALEGGDARERGRLEC